MPVSEEVWPRRSLVLVLAAALAPEFGTGVQATIKGHYLTNTELSTIYTVDCLEAKQKDPSASCRNGTGTSDFSGTITVGNFPDYSMSVCNGNGEFFCDPYAVLQTDQVSAITKEMTQLRIDNLVTCGAMLNDKVDPRHLQPFYLGVVVLKGWPSTESDPESLQQFGQIVAAQWNMNSVYAGTPAGYLTCPTTGIIVVLPDSKKAYLSTSSCEFICQARGGPEVVTAIVTKLHSGNATEGVLAGIRALYRILSKSTPVSGTLAVSPDTSPADTKGSSDMDTQGSMSNTLQRIIFAFVIIVFVLSVVVGLMLLLLGPGLLPSRRKR